MTTTPPADEGSAPAVPPSWVEVCILPLAWVEPLAVAARHGETPFAALLHSGAGRWCYFLQAPDAILELADDEREVGGLLAELLGSPATGRPDGPPFQGGVLGLAAYELSARWEPRLRGPRQAGWPDLTLARYPALLAFDRLNRQALAIGRGDSPDAARQRASQALDWAAGDLSPRGLPAPAKVGVEVTPRAQHRAAIREVVGSIHAGELFQANLARRWTGRLAPDDTPLNVFLELARTSPAPYAAYWRLRDRALVSNSPERFLSVHAEADGLWAETMPIKGTRPRSSDPAMDAALGRELLASVKDRAENLMIVDLMRNDLSRVCVPGTVAVPKLWALESFANVHHLVSTVRGRLAAGRTAWDAFLAAFPPGSVTGAPKLQAMSVIAAHEPPRGAYCGSLFWAGFDGALESSVLIRSIAFASGPEGWAFEARAGGGIVADSDPDAEVRETEDKIAAILSVLGETSGER
ncbi:anthranilate synthase component I family protein [Phenylobacterium hankyongense]|uniref:anthranilate synthase component I family protein n=1 Tax=Phenylobacterium hankyongense TaxID=1813876 RepID=UPI001FB2E57B|nr:anthranilate synthase component I family protein [Phenylobacterium hankyongense]